MSRYDIAQSYMIFGGIPYYMGYVNPEMSLAQNVDKLFFWKNAVLRDEYNRLFASVFVNAKRFFSLFVRGSYNSGSQQDASYPESWKSQ